MKISTRSIRSGYDKKKCLVHARCCETPNYLLATAQYLDVAGCDLFSGIMVSKSFDGGENWSEFEPQAELAPTVSGGYTTVGCDATPMYHKKTGKVLLLGVTAEYPEKDAPSKPQERYTFYSVFDDDKNEFSKLNLLTMPKGFEFCGNGCGQSVELPNGELLIPVYYMKDGDPCTVVTVLRCSFDGEKLNLLEIGNSLTVAVVRGLCEASIVSYNNTFYMTIRNDECGFVAKSQDGLNYFDLQLWKWEDGSILQNYNTQQHWMTVGEDLYLVYTRRAENNDHVFRHRAPLFAAKVENMKLVKSSEVIVVPEQGARLGNFGVTQLDDGTAIVMAAEWMQPAGCEKYGSNNNIFVSKITP